jgi:predicted CoA-binding protein
MSTYRLDKLFAPGSVAVVGASPRPGSLGRVLLTNLREAGFTGAIHPINPKYPEIDGLPAAARISDLPAPPDLVVIASPPPTVPDVVEEAGRKGVAAAVVITAGLGAGEGSLAEAARLAARRHGLRLVGPNCLGVMAPHARLNASFAARAAPPGDLALVSQSAPSPPASWNGRPIAGSASRRWSRSATRPTWISAIASTGSPPTAPPAPSCSTSSRSTTPGSSCRPPAPRRGRSRWW